MPSIPCGPYLPFLQWLFLIYAIITITWAVLLYFFLPDSPTSAKFLSQKERDGAIERIKVNQTGGVNHKIRWDQVWEAVTDYKIWMLFFFQLANNIPNGAITTVSETLRPIVRETALMISTIVQ